MRLYLGGSQTDEKEGDAWGTLTYQRCRENTGSESPGKLIIPSDIFTKNPHPSILKQIRHKRPSILGHIVKITCVSSNASMKG